MDVCVGSPDGGKCRVRVNLVGASPNIGFGLSLVVATERWTGRVGVSEGYPLGNLGPLEYLAISQRRSDVFGKGG